MIKGILLFLVSIIGLFLTMGLIAAIYEAVRDFFSRSEDEIKSSLIKWGVIFLSISLYISIVVISIIKFPKYGDEIFFGSILTVMCLPVLWVTLLEIIRLLKKVPKGYIALKLAIKENYKTIIATIIGIGMYGTLTYLAFHERDKTIYWMFSFFTFLLFAPLLSYIHYIISNKIPSIKKWDTKIKTFLLLFCLLFFFITPSLLSNYNYNQFIANVRYVYITEYGTKYHYFSRCHHIRNSNTVELIPLYQAILDGYTECKNCENIIIHK